MTKQKYIVDTETNALVGYTKLHNVVLRSVETDEVTRNTTNFTIHKNRFGSLTGPAGSVYFDIGTFMLSEQEPKVLPEE